MSLWVGAGTPNKAMFFTFLPRDGSFLTHVNIQWADPQNLGSSTSSRSLFFFELSRNSVVFSNLLAGMAPLMNRHAVVVRLLVCTPRCRPAAEQAAQVVVGTDGAHDPVRAPLMTLMMSLVVVCQARSPLSRTCAWAHRGYLAVLEDHLVVVSF